MLARAPGLPADPGRSREVDMPSFTLTDVGRDLWVESFAVDATGLGLPNSPAWCEPVTTSTPAKSSKTTSPGGASLRSSHKRA